MKEILAFYARCNREINREMTGIIEEAPADAFNAPVDGYFKSAGEILEHIYVADHHMLLIVKGLKELPVFRDNVFTETIEFNRHYFPSIKELKTRRFHLDALLIKMIDELADADLSLPLTLTNRKGETEQKPLWRLLVHLFNHQANLRGQVSQILDQLKIKNDNSGMVRRE